MIKYILLVPGLYSGALCAQPPTVQEFQRQIEHRREADQYVQQIRDNIYSQAKPSNRSTISGDYNSYSWSLANSNYRKQQQRAQARQDELFYQSHCLDGNCRNGSGEWRNGQGDRFVGSFRDGQPDLQQAATVIYAGGVRVHGYFKEGSGTEWLPVKKTEAKLSNGQSAWAQGGEDGWLLITDKEGMKLNARGEVVANYSGSTSDYCQGNCIETLIPQDKSYTYTGNTLHGLPEGHGTLTWANNTSYAGSFARGLPQGFGKLTYSDGTVFEGQFVQNNMEGAGTLYYPSGTTITGTWVNNKLQGEVEELADGYSYKGKVDADDNFVEGVIAFPNGRKFQGRFVNGQAYYGNLFWPDGRAFTGYFQPMSDKIVPRVGVYFGNTTEYYGYFDIHGKREGYGYEKYLKDSMVFEGHFHNDEPEGVGFLTMHTINQSACGKINYKGARIWGLITYEGNFYPGYLTSKSEINYLTAAETEEAKSAYKQAADYIKAAKPQYQADAQEK